jgi:hypothetical protein
VLKVGILTGGFTLRGWEADCLVKLSELPYVQLTLVVSPLEKADSLRERSVMIRWLENRLERSISSMRQVDVRDIHSAIQRLPIRIAAAASEYDYSSITFDLCIQLGRRQGNIPLFGIPRYGTWAFQFGSEHQQGIDGVDLIFWNLLKGEAMVSVSLVRLDKDRDHESDVGSIRGTIASITHSFQRNTEQIHQLCVPWLAALCKQVHLGYHDRERSSQAVNATTLSEFPVYRTPSILQGIGLFLKLQLNKSKYMFNRYFVVEHWNIGISPKPIESFLIEPFLDNVQWMPKYKHYYADPFGAFIDNHLLILAERYDHVQRKGTISAFRHGGNEFFGCQERVIDLPIHMSYPYLLQDNEGELFCIPETYEAREVALYKAHRFPDEWRKTKVLITDFAAVDTTVFQHDGYWWLFCTDEITGANSHLHIWYALELEQEWTPHPMNPVKIDVSSSRPAGTLFYDQGQLYRPAQDCSHTYGGAVVINRVVTLTTLQFAEEPVQRLLPEMEGAYPDGLHTLSAIGNQTLVDSKTISVNVEVFLKRLSNKLRKKLYS